MKAFPSLKNYRKKYFEEFQRDQRITEQDWRRSEMEGFKEFGNKTSGRIV